MERGLGGFWTNVGLYLFQILDRARKFIPGARIESSIIPAWGHSYGGRKKSTTHPFY